MKKGLQRIAVLLLGLLLAQCIATLQVYSSNVDLHRTLHMLKEAGYLIVPNQQISPRLLGLNAAFWGGLFFTLSVGVLLTVLSFSAAWAWNRLFRENRLFLCFCILAWLISLVLINTQGFSLLITLYFLFIPAAVFTAATKLTDRGKRSSGSREVLLLIPLLLLAIFWACQANTRFFLNLRDKLLLTNWLGTKVSEFYYEYAYYPAEPLKPLEQKLLKSCSLVSIQRKPFDQVIEKTLLAHDYLPLDNARHPVDLVVREENGLLLFQHSGKTILKTTPQEFLASPGKLLGDFSHRTDTSFPFRRFTSLSLLVGLPLVFYAVCFGLCFCIFSFLLPARISAWMASLLCLFLGITLFFYVDRGAKEELTDPALALSSESWETRVSALKLIEQKKLDVADFEAYPKLMGSHHVAERYWFARALGSSRRPSAYRDLITFLDDPNPGVVSMAFHALGQRKDSRAIPEILKRMEASDDWYNLWYAYKALRNLGWKQTKSR